MDKKQKHRENVTFQDYRQDAHKVYKRQLGRMDPDLEAYEKQKAEAVMRAARNGGLDIIESEDGELVAVDKNGTFYATADSTDFTENKPDRAAVDRLVADLQKAEEKRLKKRRDRGLVDDEGDVTYINDKNKIFNQKLARFYNKVRYSSTPFGHYHRSHISLTIVHCGDSRQLRAWNDDLRAPTSSTLVSYSTDFAGVFMRHPMRHCCEVSELKHTSSPGFGCQLLYLLGPDDPIRLIVTYGLHDGIAYDTDFQRLFHHHPQK